MALKPCRECGQSVSTEAKICPHCGVRSPVPPKPVGKGCDIGCGVLVILALVAFALMEIAKGRENEEISISWTGEPVVDVMAIAGHSAEDIAARFGAPDSMKNEVVKIGEEYPVGYYGEGLFEAVFVKGKAEWITVWGRGQIPFSNAALPALGIPARRPTEETDVGLRWKNIPGLLEINLFPTNADGNQSHYAFIEVRRPI